MPLQDIITANDEQNKKKTANKRHTIMKMKDYYL